jgi:predicted transglutaminase-like cysteine proteinase
VILKTRPLVTSGCSKAQLPTSLVLKCKATGHTALFSQHTYLTFFKDVEGP